MTTESDEAKDRPGRPEHTTSSRTDTHHRSTKRFRFKSKPSKRHTSPNTPRHAPTSSSDRHHRHHHHRHKRRRQRPSPDLHAPPSPNDPSSTLHPDIAFRESLFDALGDDEGASYWESVYGQPIHTYPDQKRNEETGQLEKMTDEEYVAFVRRGMWERSWEGIEKGREEKRRERERERKSAKRDEGGNGGAGAGAGAFGWEVEESLKRGRRRKQRKMWGEIWSAYEKGWEELHQLITPRNPAGSGRDDTVVYLRNEIVWPVESGKREDVSPHAIERFMTETAESLTATDDLGNEPSRLLSNLKLERVRWHPDKVQQRYGSLNIDEGTIRGVTEVFQVMDRLYNERK